MFLKSCGMKMPVLFFLFFSVLACKTEMDEELENAVNEGTAYENQSDVQTIPVADAGPDQPTTSADDLVALDGSGSSDADGNTLSYQWTLTSRPSGSSASLSSSTVATPTFTPDVKGSYVFELVVNDGTVDSDPDTVTISVINTPPVAGTGDDQVILGVGNLVTLNSSGSSDADGNTLSYQWTLTSRPSGSSASLSSSTVAAPTFTPDVKGSYVFELVVNDGTVDSDPDTATISVSNTAPVADAGDDQTIPNPGTTVILVGTGSSDADSDSLAYSWEYSNFKRQWHNFTYIYP